MRVSVIDPAAYTPPYDRALCAALARAGAEVELVTAAFPHGDVPRADGFAVREDFYRRAPAGCGRRAARLLTHAPDMLRASRRSADVVHFQWLAVQQLDRLLVRAFRCPRVLTAHDVLLEAWRDIADAELWIVGAPRMDTAPLHAAAPPGVRFVERFVSEGEAAALFRRADLAVLPYRQIDQSGVLFTALGFGVPLVLTAVGGFPEIAATGAAELVASGDPAALHDALAALLVDPDRRAALATAARRLASDKHDWATIARAHLDLYVSLLGH